MNPSPQGHPQSLTEDSESRAYITALNNFNLLMFNTLNGRPPETASSPGRVNQIRRDEDYLYVCVERNTWKRVALTTW